MSTVTVNPVGAVGAYPPASGDNGVVNMKKLQGARGYGIFVFLVVMTLVALSIYIAVVSQSYVKSVSDAKTNGTTIPDAGANYTAIALATVVVASVTAFLLIIQVAINSKRHQEPKLGPQEMAQLGGGYPATTIQTSPTYPTPAPTFATFTAPQPQTTGQSRIPYSTK